MVSDDVSETTVLVLSTKVKVGSVSVPDTVPYTFSWPLTASIVKPVTCLPEATL